MTSERIKEIQEETAYPESVSVQQALLQVWKECEQHENILDDLAEYCRTKTSQQIETLIEVIKPLYEQQDKSSIGVPNKYTINENI